MSLTRISPRLLRGVEVMFGTVSNVSAAVSNSVESASLDTFVIPANSLAQNGYIKWEALAAYPNSSATKTLTVKVNGTAVTAPTGTTTVAYRFFGRLVNRNSTGSQVMGGGGNSGTGVNYGNGTGVVQYFNFDTTQDITVTIHVNSSSATAETVKFEYFNLYVCYQP